MILYGYIMEKFISIDKKELNKISWNGEEPKYDIRDWAPEHEKMGKGITLSEKEMAKLKTLLQK